MLLIVDNQSYVSSNACSIDFNEVNIINSITFAHAAYTVSYETFILQLHS